MGERTIPDPDLYPEIDATLRDEKSKQEFLDKFSKERKPVPFDKTEHEWREQQVRVVEHEVLLSSGRFDKFKEGVKVSIKLLPKMREEINLLNEDKQERRKELERNYKKIENKLENKLLHSALVLRKKYEETQDSQYAERFNSIIALWKQHFGEEYPVELSIIPQKK